MNKKVVVFGGGTGLSYLLRGLKKFPLDITAVISVCDDGGSTGRLRKEFKTIAVGDIRKVIVALSEIDKPILDMMSYRFNTSSDLNGHAVGNLILTAMMNTTGSIKNSIEALSKLLDVKQKVLPVSEDADLTLVAKMTNNKIVTGEAEITNYKAAKIKRVYYKKEPKVLPEVLESIKNADLIVFSMGSLYTSILPNIICRPIKKAIKRSKAPILYTCNMVTQPGETDGFKVSDHVKLINSYLDGRKVDVVAANNETIPKVLAEKYATTEQKDPVKLDKNKLGDMKVEVLDENLISIEDNIIRHNSLKLSSMIFSYLMR